MYGFAQVFSKLGRKASLFSSFAVRKENANQLGLQMSSHHMLLHDDAAALWEGKTPPLELQCPYQQHHHHLQNTFPAADALRDGQRESEEERERFLFLQSVASLL
jgi:hypothetical protein